jgi:RNA polymerase sigma-70 factor (ECF subfamily)
MNPTTLNDHDLMLRTADGDARAFEALYRRHHAAVFGVALRVTGRRRAAEEATQDAFLSLWRTACLYDQRRGSFRSWILATARNRSIDWLRREARHDQSVEIDDAVLNRIEALDCTEEEAATRDEARTTRLLLGDLPVAQREVIALAYFGELTQVEIAKKVGVPLGTVKGRQRLALTRLHKQLHQPAEGDRPDGQTRVAVGV